MPGRGVVTGERSAKSRVVKWPDGVVIGRQRSERDSTATAGPAASMTPATSRRTGATRNRSQAKKLAEISTSPGRRGPGTRAGASTGSAERFASPDNKFGRASTSRESKCGPESWSQPNSVNEVSSNVRDLNFYTLSILIYLCYLCYLFSYINLYNLQCVCVCVCVCVCRLTQPRSRLGPQRRSSLRWTSHCIPATGHGVRLQESV